MEYSIPLSKKNEPLFRQAYCGLHKKILSGEFPPGVRLPSNRVLAEQLDVSLTVVFARPSPEETQVPEGSSTNTDPRAAELRSH